MIAGYVDSPTFYTGIELSAAQANILRRNGAVIDALSYRGNIPTASNYIRTGWPTGGTATNNPMTIWQGSFQYRNGLSNFVLSIDLALSGTETLRVNFNGVQVYNNTSLINGVLTTSIAVTGRGYAEWDVVSIDIEIYQTGSILKTGIYHVIDTYIDGLDTVATNNFGAYPTVQTFGPISSNNLNTLSNAEDWVIERLSVVPYTLYQAQRFWNGTHKPRLHVGETIPSTYPLWYGSAQQVNGASVLKVDIDYFIYNNAEIVRLYVNGVGVAASSTLTYGSAGTITLSYDLALIGTAVYEVWIDTYVTNGNPSTLQQIVNSRYNIRNMRIVRNAYPYATTLPENLSLESLRFSTVQQRLNNIGTVVTNAKARIDAAPITFNRAKVFRRRFNNDGGHQDTKFANLLIAEGVRIGSILWVRGKGIKISWGGVIMDQDLAASASQDQNLYHFINEETLVDGDVYQTRKFYLDQFKGLYPGVTYYITGRDLIGAWEYLK